MPGQALKVRLMCSTARRSLASARLFWGFVTGATVSGVFVFLENSGEEADEFRVDLITADGRI